MHDGNKAASAVRKELLKDYVFTGKLHSGPGKSNGEDAEPEDDAWQKSGSVKNPVQSDGPPGGYQSSPGPSPGNTQ